MSRLAALLIGGGLAVGARDARAEQPASLRVAIVPTVAVNLDATRVDALGQDLADALQAELYVEAVGGIEVRRAIRPDLPADCATTPACASEAAKATNAQRVLFVVMVETGSNGAAQIDVTEVDPASGKSTSRPGVSLTSTIDADAKAKFREVSATLMPDATPRPKPKAQGAVALHGDLVDGKPRHLTTPAIVTGATALVGTATTIIFGLEARSKYNACQAIANTCTQDMKDSVSHYALASDFSWGIAAAAVIATGIIYATSAESPHVVAAPVEGGAAVSWSGRF
jgi:hypothetical protein